MPDNKKPTNRISIMIAAVLCLFFGAALTQSSASPSSRRQDMPDMFMAEIPKGTPTPAPSVTAAPSSTAAPEPSRITEETPSQTPPAVSTPTPAYEISPEAAQGVWTSSNSSWMFLVDDSPYTGWLFDTDGKRYYFNEEGILQTGWQNIGKKRYYFDMDGILQTGTIQVDGKTYQLRQDGSLKGYTPKQK